MGSKAFATAALTLLGARVVQSHSRTIVEDQGAEEMAHFDGETPVDERSTLYAPGSPAFARLVSRMVATGVHDVRDIDVDITNTCQKAAADWVNRFDGSLTGIEVREVYRRFSGRGLIRARATVAHDAYERLIEVRCDDEGPSKVVQPSIASTGVKNSEKAGTR